MKITKKAAEELAKALDGVELFVRISPEPVSMDSGQGYSLTFDNVKSDDDVLKSFVNGKVRILLNKKDLLLLNNLVIEFYEDGLKKGFLFSTR